MRAREMPDPVLPNPENPLPRGDDYRHLTNNLQSMRNRVNLLKQQLAKQQQSIQRHKSMTEDIIQKKRNVGQLYKYKRRDNTGEQRKIQQLRERNNSLREEHKSQMQNILKALYLVKLDDARTLKSIAQSHRERIREMDEQELEKLKAQRQAQAQQSMLAKYKLQKYWKQRSQSVLQQQQQQRQSLQALMQQQKQQLRLLQQEQISILKQINKLHDKSSQSKKEYMAALSIPVKQIIQAFPKNDLNSSRYQSDIDLHSSLPQSPLKMQSSLLASRDITVPNTKVDGRKFKIILNQLKRLEKVKQKEKQKEMQKEKEKEKEIQMQKQKSIKSIPKSQQSASKEKKREKSPQKREKSIQKSKSKEKQKEKEKSKSISKTKDVSVQLKEDQQMNDEQ